MIVCVVVILTQDVSEASCYVIYGDLTIGDGRLDGAD